MVVGVKLSETTAGVLLTLLLIGGIFSGPILGRLTALYPLRRSNLVLVVVAITIVAWSVVLVWPGRLPLPVMVYKLAFSVQYLFWLGGGLAMLRNRRLARRVLIGQGR